MSKEFSTNIEYKEYLKNYLLAYSVSMILMIAVLIRIFTTDWVFKLELGIGLFFGYPILLLIASRFHYRTQLNTKYVFEDDLIIVIKQTKRKSYAIKNLEEVIQPTKKDYSKTGIDYVRLKFVDGSKLTFGNTIPYYSELKSYLKRYIKRTVGDKHQVV